MNFKLMTLTLCFSCCWLTQSYAGGGSVVNNGAGIVEQNFQYAYVSIDRIANDCILSGNCQLSQYEYRLLKIIAAITSRNLLNPGKIIFISEKAKPGFFTTGPSEKNRIAKTALDTFAPIYVNRDLLYNSNGTPALTYPMIIAILTHELGHQAGEPSHEILDILGAKLRMISELQSSVFKINASDTEDVKVYVTVINHAGPTKTAELLITWGNSFSRSLTQNIQEKLNCSSPYLTVMGYELQNGHFSYLENGNEIGFKALVNIDCHSLVNQEVVTEKRELSFFINKLSNVRDFNVSFWWGF
jgi:hypothetical protein